MPEVDKPTNPQNTKTNKWFPSEGHKIPVSDSYPIKPLNLDPSKFLEGYNLDIEPYVEDLTFMSKGANKVKYMSYSHAWRLFSMTFPYLGVTCETNPVTGGYIFEEDEGRGYFLKPYIYGLDKSGDPFRTASVYFPVLNSANFPVNSSTKDKNNNFAANTQLFNKAFMRSIVKVIAIYTGIGLKLWTQDDLSTEFQDAKDQRLSVIQKLVDEYNMLASEPIKTEVSYMDTLDVIKAEGKKITQMLETLKKSLEDKKTVTDTEEKIK